MTEKNIMCFGDSLTWGWVPVAEGAPSWRYPRDVRWTGVLADRLGDGYHVVEEGLSARTTTADDPADPRSTDRRTFRPRWPATCRSTWSS